MFENENELTSILNRRQKINDLEEQPSQQFKNVKKNVFIEFNEFSRNEIREYQNKFNSYDNGKDGFLDLQELKGMMEKLGAPQTHLSLKSMIKEVDEDNDGKISFREFLMIYRKANAGDLEENSGLKALTRLTEINVEEVGVGGAKKFFEAKIEDLSKSDKIRNDILLEQQQKKKEEEEKIKRKELFKKKASLFQNIET